MLYFLSCLCGSELVEHRGRRCSSFLSCLCGSELKSRTFHFAHVISELPMRQ